MVESDSSLSHTNTQVKIIGELVHPQLADVLALSHHVNLDVSFKGQKRYVYLDCYDVEMD